MNYNKLKEKIKEILSDLPADLYDEDSGLLFQSDTWELVEDRDLSIFSEEELEDWLEDEDPDFNYKAVGSANLIVANTLFKKVLQENVGLLSELQRITSNNTIYDVKESADDLFELIMTDLENERIIRKKPEILRETFKIVGGTDVRIDSTN